MNPVGLLRDPEFGTLPPDRQAGLRQEALGHVIIDPDFQTLQQADPDRAINFLIQVNGQAGRPAEPQAEALQPPGTFEPGPREPGTLGHGSMTVGQQLEQIGRGLMQLPGVVLDPEFWGSGMGATRFLKAGRQLAAPAEAAAPKAVQPSQPVRPAIVEPPTPPKPASAPATEVAPTAQPPEIVEPRVRMERATEVKEAVIANVEALQGTQASAEGQRVSRQVIEALNEGLIDVEGLPALLGRTGLTLEQFTGELLATYSTAGKQLNALSQIRKKLMALAETNPEAAKALAQLEEAVPRTWWETVKTAYTTVDNVRRGLLVSQVATTMRNISSQLGRSAIETFDLALQQTFKGEAPTQAMEWATRFFANLKPGAAAQIAKTLDAFPIEAAKLTHTPVGELHLGTKLTRLVNTLNTMQEGFFRRAAFDATLRTELKGAGMEVEAALANPSTIPDELIQKSVRNALELTFSAPAKPGTFGKMITDVWQKFPMLTTVNPFPRFWANSIEFLSTYNPAGFLRLIGKDAQGVMNIKNADKRAEILSQATIGTALFGAALAVRETDLAGPKWYQVKTGEEEGKAKFTDWRPQAPLSTFLFIADVADLMVDVGVDTIKNGGDLKRALIENRRYTIQDILQGVVSINRISGTGLVAVDLAREGALDRQLDLVRDFVAQYISGFTVPFRTIKDFVAGVSPEEAKIRETRESLIAPAAANVPGVSQLLPEAKSPTQAETPRAETPVMRQTTGVSVRSENPVQQEIDRHGVEFAKFGARTGDAEVDREIHARMGPMVETALIPLVNSPIYQQMPPQTQRFVLIAGLSLLRSQATQDLKVERPDLAARLKLDTVPREVRDLLISLGLPDLSEVGR